MVIKEQAEWPESWGIVFWADFFVPLKTGLLGVLPPGQRAAGGLFCFVGGA